MKKLAKLAVFFLAAFLFVQGLLLIKDKYSLQQNVIRLHVVAHSDDVEDQKLKLSVRDAVLCYMDDTMNNISSKNSAMEYLCTHMDEIQFTAQQAVDKGGYHYPVEVTLQKEEFPTREYDTFSLPAGCYDALRVNIGEASGKNWWCVTFPKLCLPATSESFVEVAADAGFSKSLTNTLENKDGYRLRFYLLERLNNLEKIFVK